VRVALIVCTLVACNGRNAAPEQGGGPSTTDDAATMPAPPGPHVKVLSPDIRTLPEPTIALPMTEAFRLLDPGAAPRAKLRYAWDPKANRELVVEAKLESRRLADGVWSAPLAIAPVREGFGVIATPTHSKDGGASLAFRGTTAEITGTDAGAKARAAEYVAEFKDRIEHRRGTIAVDARGQLGAIAFADSTTTAGKPDRAIDDVTERWLAAAVPLPDEPIGKGAKWRVSIVLRQGAAVVKQIAEYTLVEARADRWIIDEDVRRIGEDQLVSAPGLPQGAIAELIALFRENSGRVEVSPTSPWPIAGSLTTELRVHVKVGVPNEGVHEDITEDTGTLTFVSK